MVEIGSIFLFMVGRLIHPIGIILVFILIHMIQLMMRFPQ